MKKLVLVALVCSLAACDRLEGLQTQQPTVAYQDATLIQSPSRTMMEAYFCPVVVGYPGSLACPTFFGAAPAQTEMKVGFQLGFNVNNPNKFPVPMTEMLMAVTVFPAQTQQKLGALCISLCSADDPACTGAPGAGACTSSNKDIKSVSDFGSAAEGFVRSAGVQLASGEVPTFKKPSISSASTILLRTTYAFGPEPLLEMLKQLAQQSVSQLAAGQDVSFDIPYQLEGTIWFDVGSLGKVAVSYGPVSGTFTIPAQQIASGFPLP